MGGKSRKSGGVSKKLIAHLKSGKGGNLCGVKKPKDDPDNYIEPLFKDS